jgi:hypothetical protein
MGAIRGMKRDIGLDPGPYSGIPKVTLFAQQATGYQGSGGFTILLGVFDAYRLGGLRFKLNKDGPFLLCLWLRLACRELTRQCPGLCRSSSSILPAESPMNSNTARGRKFAP